MSAASPEILLFSDLARCQAETLAMLADPAPAFLGRLGGSDFDVVVEYFAAARHGGPNAGLKNIQSLWPIIKRFNGYYDKADDLGNVARFCELLICAYRACGEAFLCGSRLLSEFMPETINPIFHVDTAREGPIYRDFFDTIAAHHCRARFYPYSYVEDILRGESTLFHTLARVLPGKRVLVVSPFEASIQANFESRHRFFPRYDYPDFRLVTYNTPITYEGLPEDFYPDRDWFETVERMKAEVGRLEFDIALLACGSYAMPLGLHIRDALGRKAIYVGGCLQLYFGVMGRRYDNPWFLDQINREAFILPVERERFLSHVNITPTMAHEAFGAYF